MNKVEKSNHPAPEQRGTSSAPIGTSPQARRQAAAILEVLAGVHRPTEAAQVLGTSLVRYYQLERGPCWGWWLPVNRRREVHG